MEARLVNGEIFQKLVDGVRSVVHELNFRCTEDGMTANSLDDSNTVYIDIDLRADGFDEYMCDCEEGKHHKLGLNLEYFQKAMKIGFAGDSLFLRYMHNDENLHITWSSQSEERESEFQCRLMDQNVFEDYPPPGDDSSFVVEMNSTVLSKIITSYATMATSVEFTVDRKSLKLAIMGVDHLDGIVNHHIGNREGHELTITKTGNTRSITQTFRIGSWVKFMKSAGLSRLVKLVFTSEDSPCCVEYNLGDLGHVRYFITPDIIRDD